MTRRALPTFNILLTTRNLSPLNRRFDCIVFNSVAGTANDWRFIRNDKVESYRVPLANARETNDGAVAREWAVHGYGIAMKSMWDIGADLQAGRLKILLPQ